MLGQELRKIRRAKDKTLKNVADETGLSIGFISRIENDSSKPSLETLLKICKVYEIDISELEYYENENIEENIVFKIADTMVSKEDLIQIQKIIGIYLSMDSEKRTDFSELMLKLALTLNKY